MEETGEGAMFAPPAMLASQLDRLEPSDDIDREDLLQAYLDSAIPELPPSGS